MNKRSARFANRIPNDILLSIYLRLASCSHPNVWVENPLEFQVDDHLSTNVSNCVAFVFLISGQTSLHCDEIGGGIDISFGMNTVGSILVTGIIGGGTAEKRKKNESMRNAIANQSDKAKSLVSASKYFFLTTYNSPGTANAISPSIPSKFFPISSLM